MPTGCLGQHHLDVQAQADARDDHFHLSEQKKKADDANLGGKRACVSRKIIRGASGTSPLVAAAEVEHNERWPKRIAVQVDEASTTPRSTTSLAEGRLIQPRPLVTRFPILLRHQGWRQLPRTCLRQCTTRVGQSTLVQQASKIGNAQDHCYRIERAVLASVRRARSVLPRRTQVTLQPSVQSASNAVRLAYVSLRALLVLYDLLNCVSRMHGQARLQRCPKNQLQSL